MKGKRTGKTFENEWWEGMRISKQKLGGRIRNQRLYDLSDYVGKRCPKCHGHLDICGRCGCKLPISKVQPPRQPADFETVYKGMNILHECKSTRNKTSFPMRNIKPHQMASLLNNIEAGGEGYFIIQDRSDSRNIIVYCVDAHDLMTFHSQQDRESIKWEDIGKLSICHPARVRVDHGKYKVTGYDFLSFCDAVYKRRMGGSVKSVREMTEPLKKKIMMKSSGDRNSVTLKTFIKQK